MLSADAVIELILRIRLELFNCELLFGNGVVTSRLSCAQEGLTTRVRVDVVDNGTFGAGEAMLLDGAAAAFEAFARARCSLNFCRRAELLMIWAQESCERDFKWVSVHSHRPPPWNFTEGLLARSACLLASFVHFVHFKLLRRFGGSNRF